MESETDGAVKYKIFRHVGGFSDGEAHELDEVSVLRRISVEKPSFVPSKRIKWLTVSLISVDSAAGWAENQKMAAAMHAAGSQKSSFTAAG